MSRPSHCRSRSYHIGGEMSHTLHHVSSVWWTQSSRYWLEKVGGLSPSSWWLVIACGGLTDWPMSVYLPSYLFICLPMYYLLFFLSLSLPAYFSCELFLANCPSWLNLEVADPASEQASRISVGLYILHITRSCIVLKSTGIRYYYTVLSCTEYCIKLCRTRDNSSHDTRSHY